MELRRSAQMWDESAQTCEAGGKSIIHIQRRFTCLKVSPAAETIKDSLGTLHRIAETAREGTRDNLQSGLPRGCAKQDVEVNERGERLTGRR